MDERFMWNALELAGRAREQGEVPVGAVVVLDGAVIGEGFNQPISARDPTAHAEIVAIRNAAARLGNYRLTGAELYVTIEPCQMCVGAMVHARIARLVYGAAEPRAGAIESAMSAHEHPALNHRMDACGGLLEAESRALMQEFFRERRTGGLGQTPNESFELSERTNWPPASEGRKEAPRGGAPSAQRRAPERPGAK